MWSFNTCRFSVSDVWTPLWEGYANQSADPEGTVEGAKNAIVSLF